MEENDESRNNPQLKDDHDEADFEAERPSRRNSSLLSVNFREEPEEIPSIALMPLEENFFSKNDDYDSYRNDCEEQQFDRRRAFRELGSDQSPKIMYAKHRRRTSSGGDLETGTKEHCAVVRIFCVVVSLKCHIIVGARN